MAEEAQGGFGRARSQEPLSPCAWVSLSSQARAEPHSILTCGSSGAVRVTPV